ncbi:MAG: glycosyltransferase [Pseudomonadota bacterium]
MKIVLFIRSLAVGGSQRQLVTLAKQLAHHSHEVAVVVLYGGAPMESELAGSGVRLVSIDKAGRWDILGPLLRLRKVLHAERPDIIYSFQPTQTVLSALFAGSGGRCGRLVFGIRAAYMHTPSYDWATWLSYRLETSLSRRAAAIVSNSYAGGAEAVERGMAAERVFVIPNGIDTDRLQPDAQAGRSFRKTWNIPPEAFVVGMVARLDPMKDHETFLSAAARFVVEHSDAIVVCVGDGPQHYRRQLEQRAISLGLADHIRWVGESKDVLGAYNAFDIATLSSAFGEGFPNVVAEAMACGVPIVVTDCGDAGLIVGNIGEAVPSRQPDSLYAAWSKLRQRMARDSSIGATGREAIVADYSVIEMVRRTELLFSALCGDQIAAAEINGWRKVPSVRRDPK